MQTKRNDTTREYWLNEAQSILICMLAETEAAGVLRHEITDIVMAWRRGRFLPRSSAPMIMRVLDEFPEGSDYAED